MADKHTEIGLWFAPWPGGAGLDRKNQYYRYLLIFNNEGTLEKAYFREWQTDEDKSQQLTKELIAFELKKLSDLGDVKATLILKRDYGSDSLAILTESTSEIINKLKKVPNNQIADSMYQIYSKTSYPENIHWLCGAADLSHKEAMYRIGDMFWFGNKEISLEINLIKAYKWYVLASLQEHYWAKKAALRVAGRLNENELIIANKMINDWKKNDCIKDFDFYTNK